eukprot:g1408.t1
MGGNKLKGAETGKALGDAIALNTVLKELDLSSPESYSEDKSDAEFAKAFSVGLGANGALTSLNIKDNSIENEGKTALGNALLKSNVQFMVCDEWAITQETLSLDVSGKKLAAADAVLLAGVISTNGVLTSLNISDNSVGELIYPTGWHFEQRSKENKFVHSDGRKQDNDPGEAFVLGSPDGAVALADSIKNNGALETITFGDEQAATMKTDMANADFSGKRLGASGAIIVAAFLPKCQALETITFGDEQAATMKTDITEADLSGKELGDSGAIIVAAFLPKCHGNDIRLEGAKSLAETLKGNQRVTELDISSNRITDEAVYQNCKDMSGVTALADAIPTMGALVKFTISGEQYYDDGFKDFKYAPPVTIEASMTEAEFSGKQLGTSGAIMLAAFLPKCRALVCDDGKYYHEWRLNPRHGEVVAAFLELEGSRFECPLAEWSPPINEWGLKPNTNISVVAANPPRADGDLANADELQGNVAIVSRGGCNWAKKAERIQATGAIAMICANDDQSGAAAPDEVFVMGGKAAIPACLISFNNGTKIKSGASVIYHVKTVPKFISSAPDVDGQDHDPGVPLATGICLHCGQPKDQHRTKGALTSLNISSNNIGQIVGWKYNHPSQANDAWRYEHSDGRHQKERPHEEMGKPEGVIALAESIKNNGTLAKLIFGGDKYKKIGRDDEWITPEPATLEVGMIEADLSNKNLGVGGAIIIGAWISHKDNGALTSVNILANSIGVDQANELIKMMESHKSLKTLCGLSGDETELDFSGKYLTAGCGVLVSNEIKNNGALEKLAFAGTYQVCVDGTWQDIPCEPAILAVDMAEADLSKTNLGAGGAFIVSAWMSHKDNGALVTVIINKFALPIQDIKTKAELDLSGKGMGPEDAIVITALLPLNGAMTSLDISNNNLGIKRGNIRPNGYKEEFAQFWGEKDEHWETVSDASGVIALADGIKNNGALTSLNMSKNKMLTKAAGKALGDMLKANSVLKELDVSSNYNYYATDGAGFVWSIADGIKNNGALTSLDISNNNIGELVFVEDGWTRDTSGDYKSWMYKNTDGREQKEEPPTEPKGAIALASAISTNGALVKLSIRDNQLLNREAGKIISDMLKENNALKELDVSDNNYNRGATDGPGFAQELAIGLGANGALTSLNVSNNLRRQCIGLTRGAANDTDDVTGVIALADAIKNNGAIVSVNILNTNIGAEQAQSLAVILKEHATLKSLCGNKGDETELDMSGKNVGADGAIMLAPEIVANGAITGLNISHNKLTRGKLKTDTYETSRKFQLNSHRDWSYETCMSGVIAVADLIKTNRALTSLNISTNNIGELVLPEGWNKETDDWGNFTHYQHTGGQRQQEPPEGAMPEGAIVLADAISTNGAMVSVNILDNNIGTEQAQKLVAVLKEHPTLKSLCGNKGDETELDMSGKNMGADGAIMLAPEIVANEALTSLNLVRNNLHAEGAKHIAEAIKVNVSNTKGALMSLNIGNNNIPIESMKEIIALVESKPVMKVLCAVPFRDKTITELDISNQNLGFEGALVISRYLENNGALEKLIFGGNAYENWDEGAEKVVTITPDPAVLQLKMTEADLSKKNFGPGGAIITAAWISHKDNGALTSLNLSNNKIGLMVAPEGWIYTSRDNDGRAPYEYRHTDGRKQAEAPEGSKPEGIIALADAIKNNGALASVNILKNGINVEQVQTLVEIMRSKKSLTTLCGLTGKETELDFSKQGLGAGDAVLIANDIRDNGALETITFGDVRAATMQASMTEADFSGKKLGASGAIIVAAFLPKCHSNQMATKEAGRALAQILKANSVLKELDVSDNVLRHAYEGDTNTFDGADGSGFAQELAVGVSANGALSKLIFGGDSYYDNQNKRVTPEPAILEVGMTEADLSNKNLGAGGAMIVGAWISHKDNGALETITFGDAEAATMKADMTEADFSSKGLGASGAMIVAAFLPKCRQVQEYPLCPTPDIFVAIRAMTNLNISSRTLVLKARSL